MFVSKYDVWEFKRIIIIFDELLVIVWNGSESMLVSIIWCNLICGLFNLSIVNWVFYVVIYVCWLSKKVN